VKADLMERFTLDLPHLRDKIITAAADIAELEILLDDAETAGLRYVHAGWLSLRETHLVVAESEAVGWINYLTRLGFSYQDASFAGSGGDVTAHSRHRDGRRMALTMKHTQEQAA